jgi:RNA 2',3'-cyclic 3'-phosphodiesterase
MAPHATARLFVALDPPLDVREQLAGWARTALRSAGERTGAGQPLRVLDPESLHVTLCFLGSQPLEIIEPIGALLASATGAVGELSVGAPLWLPPRRPRALAVELHEDLGRLSELHHRLVAALADVCELDGQAHPPVRGAGRRRHRFRPHITVARIRSGGAPRKRTLAPTPKLSFTPRELVLYRSWLRPEGAEYERVAYATLLEQPS